MQQERPKRPLSGIAALMLVVGAAACASAGKAPPFTGPSPERLAAAYPSFATQIDMSGRVDLSCTGDADGKLRDCVVVKAEPAGMGFEEAALGLAGDIRLAPAGTKDAQSRRPVQFALPFTLGPRPPSPQPWSEGDPQPEALQLARDVVGRWPTPVRPDPRSLDMASDRADWVADLVWSTDLDREPEWRDAWILALARLQSPDQLRMLTVGQRRPAPFAQDTRSLSAQDRLIAHEDLRAVKLRQAYCQRYDCGQFEAVF